MKTFRSMRWSWAISCACGPAKKFPSTAKSCKAAVRVDESMVTGEAMPVTKTAGDRVIGGTLNGSGSLVIRAEKVGRDTMLAQIVNMVAQAQRSRAPIQRLADQVSGWFVPLVIAIAVLAFAAWAVWGPEPRFSLRADRSRFRADHCVSLRTRARDADVDHGRRRPRRPRGRPDKKRRSLGTHGKGRHADRRQDRNADRGQAEGNRHLPRSEH